MHRQDDVAAFFQMRNWVEWINELGKKNKPQKTKKKNNNFYYYAQQDEVASKKCIIIIIN